MNVIDVSKVIDEERKTICFTGHRPNKLVGYTSRVPYTVFVKRLKEMLRPLIEQGYTRFITGGAQGIDQLAFWAVEGLKKKVILFRISYMFHMRDRNCDGMRRECFRVRNIGSCLKRQMELFICIKKDSHLRS